LKCGEQAVAAEQHLMRCAAEVYQEGRVLQEDHHCLDQYQQAAAVAVVHITVLLPYPEVVPVLLGQD
jgi:hypothetical protein